MLLVKPAQDPQKECFDRLCNTAGPFASEDVVGAAANLMVAAIGIGHVGSKSGLARFDEVMARARGALMQSYKQREIQAAFIHPAKQA